jgi:hypothetical protein
MKLYIYMAIFAQLLLLSIVLMLHSCQPTVAYDCRLAEISPDYPPSVRVGCRQLQRIQLAIENGDRNG